MAFLLPDRLRPPALLLCLTLAACSSTREIETAPPRPREAIDASEPSAARQARLLIQLETGESDLPAEVASLRFRITELHIRQDGGEWLRLPTDVGMVELPSGGHLARRTLLDTRVPPGSYDSLAVYIDRIFVSFGENSGGPLTVSEEAPLKIAASMAPDLQTPAQLSLTFEPGPSLVRDADCRWFFLPFIRSEQTPVN